MVHVFEKPDERLRLSARITVAVLAVVRERGRPDGVLLVQPSKDESGLSWILPQGGVEVGERYYDALYRELHQELPGIEIHRHGHPCFGARVHTLPVGREFGVKNICCFGARVSNVPPVTDGVENTGVQVMYRPAELFYALEGAREDKRNLILDVVKLAHQIKFLSWSCEALRHARTHEVSMSA